MRVVILIPKLNAGAEWALNRLLEHQDVQVLGVVRSDNSMTNKRYWRYLFQGLRRWGFFYALLVGLFYTLHIVGVFIAGILWWRRKKKWLSVDRLVQKYQLKVHDTDNINSKQSLEVLASWEPDVVVSLYFDQILKKDALGIAKRMNLNMHPGPLPGYKGLWPAFWQLYNRAKQAGVTVHEMTEKVDSGKVFAVKQFPIHRRDTKYSLWIKSAHYGAEILGEVLRELQGGSTLKSLAITGKAKYYSLPSRKQIRKFFQRKRRLFWLPSEFKQIDQLV